MHLALGSFAALLAVCYLVADKGFMSFGFGYWIVLVGCLGLLAGAVLLERNSSSPTGRSTGEHRTSCEERASYGCQEARDP